MIQIVNKKGDIIKVKPKINSTSFRNTYNIKIGNYESNIKAINEICAMFKFCLKHPLVLFKIDKAGD